MLWLCWERRSPTVPGLLVALCVSGCVPPLLDDLRLPGQVEPSDTAASDTVASPPEQPTDRPRLAELPTFSIPPSLTDGVLQDAARLKAGEFRASDDFEWLPIGVPPPWDENPTGSSTWDLWRHSLRWTQPLVAAWFVGADQESSALVREIVRDWHAHNAQPPGASPYAWGDHAIANRLEYFCWLWELYRTSDDREESFTNLLLELIEHHAADIASGRTYVANSNHALIQNVALLVAAATMSELDAAEDWRAIASERTLTYVQDNFSREGFHLEQSPGYHLAVLRRLGNTVRFLRVNDQPPLPGIEQSARRAASVWPWLIRPTGWLVDVGDTWATGGGDYLHFWTHWWGDDILDAAASTGPNPRQDAAEFLLSFDAGYAIFTAYPIRATDPHPDTYAFFKCNAFPYAHYHRDALSFLLSGMGHDWLIDSGVHSHAESSPERLYVRSPRAHSLVLVDEQDFQLGPVELVAFGRTLEGDFVGARHHLPQATHTRTFRFVPPVTIEITDELAATDGQAHTYTQLFQVEPTLGIKIVSDRRVHLVADDRKTCVIEQHGLPGQWRIITGQTEPHWQGWLATGFEQIKASPTLCYSSLAPLADCEFSTTIWLAETEP